MAPLQKGLPAPLREGVDELGEEVATLGETEEVISGVKEVTEVVDRILLEQEVIMEGVG